MKLQNTIKATTFSLRRIAILQNKNHTKKNTQNVVNSFNGTPLKKSFLQPGIKQYNSQHKILSEDFTNSSLDGDGNQEYHAT